jgi:formylglycine-generating enzyme required for sulfatase activity
MRRWFLSYTSQDFVLTQALEAALQRRDADAHIFFAPESMRAGGFWQQQLADEIAQSTAFVLLVGETGVGPWQVMEYHEALDRRAKEPDYPLILILSEKTVKRAAPGLPFVRQLHWVLTEDPASEATVGKLIDAASGPATRPRELWRHTRPYRGLEAMTEANSDFFFGRGRETVEVINVLAGERGKLPILLGNSGVGKSSLAQAGVLAALLRQGWPEQVKDAPPWPTVFDRSRHWCFLTLRPGTDPLKALVAPFLDTWQYGATNPKRVTEQNEWIEVLRDGKATLPDLLDATEKRYLELAQPSPPAFFLYIDQGEELYVRAEKPQRRRFSEIVATGLADPRLRALMSLRADFFGQLQKDEPLYGAHRQINVPPLREAELNEIVRNPARLLSARFQTDTLAADIARRAAEESAEDAGALPLLSYLLDDMWSEMVERRDGVLRLPVPAIDLGRVLVERANKFVAEHPGAEDVLRRILTLKLATVREDGEPTRRRAARSEFTDEEWWLVSELADHPNRLLVTATPEAGAAARVPQTANPRAGVAAGSGETYAEVAHEAIFRRWDKLREWIAAEREFLAWRSGLETARRTWQATPEGARNDTLLMGAALTQAQSWRGKRSEDLSAVDREFIDQSTKREAEIRARARRAQALVYVLLVGIILGLIGVINQPYIKEQVHWYMTMRPYRVANVDPYVLTPERERALRPGDSFRECAKDCPEMVVVPAGEFTMGSPATEKGRYGNEGPQHSVAIPRPFAVSKSEVTFADWDACVAVGGCPHEGRASDTAWGRGRQPVIYVSWDDAQAYVAWLSRMTGKTYRLLTEAEWEYAARAGSQAAYSWGDEIGKGNANCNGCGSQWDYERTAPVGSFAANAFGLHDMHGNVWEWVEDCYHADYNGAPKDGSAWIEEGECSGRVVRGGSWVNYPRDLRAAIRNTNSSVIRIFDLGFRVGRTLDR